MGSAPKPVEVCLRNAIVGPVCFVPLRSTILSLIEPLYMVRTQNDSQTLHWLFLWLLCSPGMEGPVTTRFSSRGRQLGREQQLDPMRNPSWYMCYPGSCVGSALLKCKKSNSGKPTIKLHCPGGIQ